MGEFVWICGFVVIYNWNVDNRILSFCMYISKWINFDKIVLIKLYLLIRCKMDF